MLTSKIPHSAVDKASAFHARIWGSIPAGGETFFFFFNKILSIKNPYGWYPVYLERSINWSRVFNHLDQAVALRTVQIFHFISICYFLPLMHSTGKVSLRLCLQQLHYSKEMWSQIQGLVNGKKLISWQLAKIQVIKKIFRTWILPGFHPYG